ncbi:phage head closure protein [Lactococcus piscium]|uniref:phage head closure protein n=1 Tax=Pseudolactococcus paracarnosus TaxID=2749962 RepID=UPI001FBBE195|nr:phage head closure protein [Lactococcus paracarnosus]MCJ1993799.1 phage head closure protein [Lactococcus paracarnosus]
MAKINLADFNHKLSLGNVESVKNPNTGATARKFKAEITLWFASKTRTLAQQYQLQGTDLENTRTVIIKHNKQADGLTVALIDGVQYNIVSYSPDETNNVIRYDYLTLKRSS